MNDEKTSKANDFFNLESSDSEEEEIKLREKTKVWDWDKEENRHMYYKNDYKSSSEKIDSKLVSGNYDSSDSDEEYGSNIKKHKPTTNKTSLIEKVSNNSKLRLNLNGHRSSVNRIHWARTKDNRNKLLSSSMDKKFIIWNLDNESYQIFDNIHTGGIRNAIWSRYDTEIISVGYDQSCAITDTRTGLLINRFKHDQILSSVCNNPKDDNLIVVGSKHMVLSWDKREDPNKKPCKMYKSVIGQVQDLLFINDDEFVSCGDIVCQDSAEYSIVVWDYKTTASISNQIFHERYVCTCLQKHPVNSLFYGLCHGNYIAEFSTNPPYKMNKNKKFRSANYSTEAYAIGFDINSNGTVIYSGSADGAIYLYNTASSKLLRTIDVFNRQIVKQPCMDVKIQREISNGRQYLAASSWNGQIKILDNH